jgi:cytochrome P450
MVFEEALRLYPPVWFYSYSAVEDDVIGGYHVPAGSGVWLAPYVTHRLPAFWPDPERFDPTRFAAGNDANRPRYAYFPFNGGPHQCLGNHFALMEAQLIISIIAQHFCLQMVSQDNVLADPVLTLRPVKGMLAMPCSRTA